MVFKEVKAHHVGNPVSRSSTKTNRTQNARNKSSHRIVLCYTTDFTFVDKRTNHIQSQYVSLCFLPRRIIVCQSLSHITLSVHGILYSQTVSHLMESNIVEESIKLHILQLLLAHHIICNRLKDFVKLGFHCVFELQSSCTLFELNPLIVRQIDSNRLAAGITITCIEDYIIHIEV